MNGLYVASNPDLNLLAVGDTQGRIPAIVSHLQREGWAVGMQGNSERHEVPTMHLTVTAGHLPVVGEFLADLAASADVSGDETQGRPWEGSYN